MNFLPKRKQAPKGTALVAQFVTTWSERERSRAGAKAGPFVLDGAKVTDNELASPVGLLPLFVWHADSLYKYGVRPAGLGVEFGNDDDALLKRSVSVDRAERSVAEILCFVLEAMQDARQHLPQSVAAPGAVELRGLVTQFALQMGVTHSPVVGADEPGVNARLQA